MRIVVVAARFNPEVTERLLDGAEKELGELGAAATALWVPGAFELPLAAHRLASSGEYDAVVCLGAVIRGETTHYELVSEGAAQGVQQVQLATGVPIAFGLVTVENEAQALARSEGPGGHNVGEEAALVAVEMARMSIRHRGT